MILPGIVAGAAQGDVKTLTAVVATATAGTITVAIS